MSRPLRILDCAKAELRKAMDRYDRQLPGLGESLRLSVDATIDAIELYPESYQIDFGIVRRAPTRRFPFAVYYRVLPQVVEVAAVFDRRIDPSVIRSRIDAQSRH